MNNVLIFLKTKKILFLASFGIIVIIAYLLAKEGQEPTISPTPLPTTAPATWRSLLPGTSTLDDVFKDLGQPIKTIDGGTLLYSSESKNRNHEVVVKENKVVFIKEIITVNGVKIPDMETKYGKSKIQLYGLDDVYSLFVYPDKGVAYVGNPTSNTVSEIWYFEPTTLDRFLLTWAQEYSSQPRGELPHAE